MFTLECDLRKPCGVEGDRLRIRQILTNLLSNAIKFTPSGGRVVLRAAEQRQESSSVYVRFEVEDTGIGMSEEYLSRIFTPFEQESAATAQNYGGSGLGLSITYNLIQMLHGSITVCSTPGKGSIFTVMLPFVLAREAASTVNNQKSSENEAHHISATLLLAEDNRINREIAMKLLDREGMRLIPAENGRDAVLKFTQSAPGTFQAILMDLRMPVMDGYEAARAIRASGHPDAKCIPIIAVSADVFEETITRALSCGMNDYITKPIDFNELCKTLDKLVNLPKHPQTEK